jgi:beta-glucanase (GH16 family)
MARRLSVKVGSLPPASGPLVDPATPAGVKPVGQASFAGTLAFSDEFAAGSLNSSKWIPWYPDTSFWNATVPGGHKTNTAEPQGYDETGITFDSNGMKLTLRQSNHAVPELSYTSGMVCSYPAFGQTYGYFEASIQSTNADGGWPAFWMDCVDQSWPPEIDIYEQWTRSDGLNHVYRSTLIWPEDRSQSDVNIGLGNETHLGFHVYGLLWEPGRTRFYHNGTLVKDYTEVAGGAQEVPSKAMYMICNLAGDNAHVDRVATAAPFSISVRYIRAWSLT